MMERTTSLILSAAAWICLAAAIPGCGPTSKGAGRDAASSSLQTKGHAAEATSTLALPLRMLQLAAKSQNGKNFAVSPHSAAAALSLLEAGASGSTRDALEKALGGRTVTPSSLPHNDDVALRCANSLWIREGFPVHEAYKDTLRGKYGADVFVEDFSQDTRAKIDSWCSDATEGLIPAMGGRITPDQKLILLNAVYFKADWGKPFEGAGSKTFHGIDGDVNVPFMERSLMVKYAQRDGWTLVEIPYKGEDYALRLLLPPTGKDPLKSISSLGTDLLGGIIADAVPERVALCLPKFKIESSLSLAETVKALGAGKIFSSAADFSPISPAGGLCVSSIQQKCLVDVDEKGTKAAAVTQIVMGLTALPDPPLSLTVDRPYIFAVVDTRGENVLFDGLVSSLP